MNHTKVYSSIVGSYKHIKTRQEGIDLFGYVERHHIIPECLDGPDTDENQVYLPARVHFILHRLLVKMHPENGDLWLALKIMSQGKRKGLYKYTSKTFDQIRKRCAETNRGRKISDATRAKMSAASKLQVHTAERRMKCSETQKGRKKTEEQKRKNSESHKGILHTEETKAKLSNSLKGRPFSDEHRKNLALSRMGKKHSEETLLKMRTPRKKTRERLQAMIQ